MTLTISNCVVTSDVDTYFVNKDTGQPLAGGQLFFYRDSARNVPKEVYQIAGNYPNYSIASMGAVVTLSASGTVQNESGANQVIYYYPYDIVDNLDLYYIVCKDAYGVVQFTREAWPNKSIGSNPVPGFSSRNLSNQISNPTFTNMFISPDITTELNYQTGVTDTVVPIAPNWDLVITGTGTIEVSRVAFSGQENVPTRPPYSIKINSPSTITELLLRQRFYENASLWSSLGSAVYLSSSFVAKISRMDSQNHIMAYYMENSLTPALILDAELSSEYSLFRSNSIPITPSISTEKGQDAYVDIYFKLPVNSTIELTQVSVIPSEIPLIQPPYDIDSSNRNMAYQGAFYIPNLLRKPISSYLDAWDFSVNPGQFTFSQKTMSSDANFIVDRTIGQVSSTITEYKYTLNRDMGSLVIEKTVSGESAFYISQHITPEVSKAVLKGAFSFNFDGFVGNVSNSTDVIMRVYILVSNTDTNVGYFDPGTVSDSGIFTPHVTYSEIENIKGNQKYRVKRSAVYGSYDTDIGINGWSDRQLPLNGLPKRGVAVVVVTFTGMSMGDKLIINSISLVPGNLPSRPAPRSYEDTLLSCQRFYETSISTFDYIRQYPRPTGDVLLNNSSFGIALPYSDDEPPNPAGRGMTVNFKALKFSFNYTFSIYTGGSWIGKPKYYYKGATVSLWIDWHTVLSFTKSLSNVVIQGIPAPSPVSRVGFLSAAIWTAESKFPGSII